jgi:AraC family transcriptional regulator of adaptative response / DNA-3-methyladenine glycosylase II
VVAAAPGIRLPGCVEPAEIVLRALLGQQVTVAAARTAAARLVEALGEAVDTAVAGLTNLFPTAARVAERGAEVLRGPARRTASITRVATALAEGSLRVHAGRDPEELRAELLDQPGIGPWTAGYVLMRVLGATDELLFTDVALRNGAAALGLSADALAEHAPCWRPWRSYAGMHLWRAAATKPAVAAPRRTA